MTSKPFYKRILYCVWGITFFLPVITQGQNVTKLLQKADAKYNTGYMTEARELYADVLEASPNNFRAAMQLGRVYTDLEDYQQSLIYYQRALQIDPRLNDTLYLRLGITHKRLGNYRRAKETFLKFKEIHPAEDELSQRADQEIEGCDLAESYRSKNPPYELSSVSFNSAAGDQFPAYLDQRQEDVFLVFESYRRQGNRSKKNFGGKGEPSFSDLFYVTMQNDSTFGVVKNFAKNVNKKYNDGTPAFSPNGLSMYFTICNSKANPNGCNIYESKFDPVRKSWGKPFLSEGLAGKKDVIINDRGKSKTYPTDDRQPTLSRDGRTIYFVSDRPGGKGGFDIWYSRKLGAKWGPPVNLTTINTSGNELSPFLTPEGDRLYFASKGWAGFGGFDLFVSNGSGAEWDTPTNLGTPYNSSYDDYGGIWMKSDSLAFITSNRPGGVGRSDIYRVQRVRLDPDKFQITVQGLIRDKVSKQPIPFATAILYEYQPDDSIIPIDTFETDQSARYLFPLRWQKQYKILGNAPEYLANEEDVSTIGIEGDATLEKNIDIELEPIVIDRPIVLQNIYYDFDEYYLRPDAVQELNELIDLLNQNPNLIIQMGSHTDSNGTEQYNDGLSNNRAKAAVRYLVENGIDPGRLSWFGFGESQPLVFPENGPEDEQANRRTEFRIISIDFDQLVEDIN